MFDAVLSNGSVVTIKFLHVNPTLPPKKERHTPKTMTRMDQIDEDLVRYTSCTVENDKGEILGTGFSQVHPNDNFERSIGRALSLTRAISDADLKEEEKSIVDHYNDAHSYPMFSLKEARQYRDYLNRYVGALEKA